MIEKICSVVAEHFRFNSNKNIIIILNIIIEDYLISYCSKKKRIVNVLKWKCIKFKNTKKHSFKYLQKLTNISSLNEMISYYMTYKMYEIKLIKYI